MQQKVNILNRILYPKITYGMKFFKYSEDTIKALETTTREIMANYEAELGLKSIRSLQDEMYLNTIIYQCINFGAKLQR